MKKEYIAIMSLVIAFALPAAARAQQLFDFNGQAVVPTAIGGALSLDSVIYDPAPAAAPLPLAFDGHQYTLVITGLILDLDGITQAYSGGSIMIYEDTATAADHAVPATFSDGTVVLSGVITSLNRTLFPGASIGSLSGFVNWTGGRDLDEFAPEDQMAWPILSAFNTRPANVRPGYDENWDGKVEPQQLTVSNSTLSWGQVKALF